MAQNQIRATNKQLSLWSLYLYIGRRSDDRKFETIECLAAEESTMKRSTKMVCARPVPMLTSSDESEYLLFHIENINNSLSDRLLM